MSAEFELWLEFEQTAPVGTAEPYFIMNILMQDGRAYGLNVWVASAIEEILDEDFELGVARTGGYAIAPDLIVRSHERAFLEAMVRDLIASGQLKEEWLIPPEVEGPESDGEPG